MDSPDSHEERRSGEVCLLLGDVDAIKAFVYESEKLPEIRGASQLLVELENEVKQLLANDPNIDLIYCGGGSFLAIAPPDIAEEKKKDIEQLYLKRTKAATITVVLSPPLPYEDLSRGVPPHDPDSLDALHGEGVAGDLLFSHFEAVVEKRSDRKNFGEWVAFLSADLRSKKLAKKDAPFVPAFPIHRRCQSCGKRPASVQDKVTGEWLCQICWDKRERGRAAKRTVFVEEFAKWFENKYGILLPISPPQDFSDLIDARGKIAFLYADGNNIGGLLQMAETPSQYREISKALESALKDALFNALVVTFGEENLVNPRGGRLRFEIIALGGDDVTVVVPACYGWKLALELLRRFAEAENLQRLGKGRSITLSAGLVFADLKYPVHFTQKLSESLLREAKRLFREAEEESTLCHLWLRAPIAAEDAAVVMDSLYLRDGPGRRKLRLTARPFTLKQARKLTEFAEKLKLLPSHQRRVLAEGLEKGVHTSVNLALYQAQRLEKEKAQDLLDAFQGLGDLVSARPSTSDLLFWRQDNGEWRTALLDALELVELGGV